MRKVNFKIYLERKNLVNYFNTKPDPICDLSAY